jgi:chromosome segregation ATPase
MPLETDTAEQRFREAFERLKAGRPQVLPSGTIVSQNNVAKEAGTDPSALRLTRYPALIRDIQAWVKANNKELEVKKLRKRRQLQAREDMKTRLKTVEKQRDEAQSKLVSAHRLILELRARNALLETRLNDLAPPPTPLWK